jgi:putative membrane-bound dehydrogenase-like protein
MRATGIDCGNLRPWERVERLRRAACRAVLLLGGSLAAVEAASEPLAAVDPHAPGQFDHHPDIAIQLWAAEPLVVDPVAVSFAADGTCFVAEMRDYPFGVGPDRRPGGTVRRLRDTDGDGAADEAVVFADGLSFPTAVLAWQTGLLVLAPPQLLYLEDTDGDGVADRRDVVVEGFALGVTDSNANSLRFGLDGLVHLANGGNGGRLWFAGTTGEPVALGRADAALDLWRREIRRTCETAGGFGLIFDGAGHRFTTYNIDYLQQQILPLEQLERAGDVAAFAATETISDEGPSARLFPVVTATTRVNHPEQAGRFSSAGGTGFLDGTPFAPRLANSVFVCDVVTNLVHRDLVREAGPTFRAGRGPEEQGCEFIASRDPACRPVGLEHGPDGGMYLIDMQRDVIEHPNYIPAATLAKLDLRAGSDRGRIYRIVPRGGLEPPGRPLDGLAAIELVAELDHPFRWRRETAHRLLAEIVSGDAVATAAAAGSENLTALEERLRELLATGQLPEARLRAAWLLAATGRLVDSDLERALADVSPEVRENAVAWLRLRPDSGEQLVALLDDPHPRVRFTAALALDGRVAAGKAAALGRMLARDVAHAWSRRAVALAADDEAADVLSLACQAVQGTDEAAWQKAIHELSFTAASASGRRDRLERLLDAVDPRAAPHAVGPLLAGLLAGWQRHPEAIGDKSRLAARITTWSGPAWLAAGGPGLVATLLDLSTLSGGPLPAALVERVDAARQLVADDGPQRRAAAERLAAVEILARASGAEATDALVAVLARPESGEIKRAVIAGLQRQHAADLGERLIAAWARLGPAIRPQVVALLVSDRRHHAALLGAIETGAIGLGELNLDLEQRRSLRRWTRPDLALRAARLLGDEEYANRRPLVADWLARMPADGDPAAGREVFRERCGSCHVAHGVGHRVGPDLEALSHRSVEDLVSHVLDPNMAINPGYVSCVVELEDGRSLTGLLAVDGADAITILQPEAKQITVPRGEIADLRMLSTSLMPEGLEQLLTPAQLRSVIAFIQAR